MNTVSVNEVDIFNQPRAMVQTLTSAMVQKRVMAICRFDRPCSCKMLRDEEEVENCTAFCRKVLAEPRGHLKLLLTGRILLSASIC